MSKTMAMRLEASKGRIDGTVLFVEFERQLDHVWVVDVPKRQAAILEQVRAHAGQDWTVQFVVVAKVSEHAESEAVELPAEGERLEQLARGILGAP